MRAGPLEVGLLLQNRTRYCVPIYQRHYVWTRPKQWEPFWNDVRTKAIERLAGRKQRFSHFMGAVVLESRGLYSAAKVPSYLVIDGQQRLTTFQLFLVAARHYALAIKLKSTEEKIASYLFNDKPHLMADPEIEIFKVWPTQYDRELFLDLLLLSRDKLRDKYAQHFYAKLDRVYDYRSVPNLLGAYGYFYDRIRHSVETDDLDDEFAEPTDPNENFDPKGCAGLRNEVKLDAIWQSLVEEFKVVEIQLDDGDDAQVIFETLNERGEPLLAADLVRNNVFQRADANGEKAEDLFRELWKPFEFEFWSAPEKQGRYLKPRIEFFLSNFITGQIASEINLSKLFSEYKAFIKKRIYASVADELRELGKFGSVYRELVERDSDSALAHFSRRLLPWDVTTVFPLVLRLWTAEMPSHEKGSCLQVLLSYIVRRAICGLSNKNYNKLFLSAISHLDGHGWCEHELVSFLFGQRTDIGRFPRDEEFGQRWLSIPAYVALQPLRTRAVLEEIEKAKRTKFHETRELAPKLTVEHILPQNWAPNWPLPDGSIPTSDQLSAVLYATSEDDTMMGAIMRRNRLKESFGNLTVLTTPLNSSVSNGPFATKRAALEAHSLLVLNREIVKHDTWDEDKILGRGRQLLACAQTLWPVPSAALLKE